MKKKFRAIVASNKTTRTGSEFKLLINIEGIDNSFKRDHCWISYVGSKKQLNKLKLHQIIEFDAEMFNYLNKGTRLRNIRNVKVVGNKSNS